MFDVLARGRIDLGGVVLEVNLEDRLQAVTQVFAALETQLAGITFQVGCAFVLVNIVDTGVEMTEDGNVRKRGRHTTYEGGTDHCR